MKYINFPTYHNSQGDLPGIKQILQTHNLSVDVPVYDEENQTFMTLLGMAACRKNFKNGLEMMRLLLDSKASINAQSDLGQTPISMACEAKNTPAARLLLEYKTSNQVAKVASNSPGGSVKDVNASHAGMICKLDSVDYRGWSPLAAASSLPTHFSTKDIHTLGMESVVLVELLIWYIFGGSYVMDIW